MLEYLHNSIKIIHSIFFSIFNTVKNFADFPFIFPNITSEFT